MGDVVVVQADTAVVHEDEFVAETGDFAAALVVEFDFFLEVGRVVDADWDDFQDAGLFATLVEIRPHAAQHLGDDSGAVVVGFFAVLEVSQDEKDRGAASVFWFGEVRLQAVETSQHHLEAGFHAAAGSG